jgi:AbrB family looped-hinge helix DNA binding protein
MSIVKIREKYQVTIPEDVREKIACEVGEYVSVETEGSRIVLKPLVLEEKFSPEEIASLEKILKKQRGSKIMNAEESKKYLETL